MIRTQIYIPKYTHDRLVQLARARKEALAKIVREFIEAGIEKSPLDQSGKTNLQELIRLNFRGGPKDLSTNLNRYLYGGRQ
ncbi:MAG TPA: hypothetical protein VGA53_04365 [Candidatus Paceibacterota bacterium]